MLKPLSSDDVAVLAKVARVRVDDDRRQVFAEQLHGLLEGVGSLRVERDVEPTPIFVIGKGIESR